jgi:hypothetical protein
MPVKETANGGYECPETEPSISREGEHCFSFVVPIWLKSQQTFYLWPLADAHPASYPVSQSSLGAVGLIMSAARPMHDASP